jgi:hypothetical protein
MYENGKMRPAETTLGMGEGGKKRMVGLNSTVRYYKDFCKCHNVPSVQQ